MAKQKVTQNLEANGHSLYSHTLQNMASGSKSLQTFLTRSKTTEIFPLKVLLFLWYCFSTTMVFVYICVVCVLVNVFIAFTKIQLAMKCQKFSLSDNAITSYNNNKIAIIHMIWPY